MRRLVEAVLVLTLLTGGCPMMGCAVTHTPKVHTVKIEMADVTIAEHRIEAKDDGLHKSAKFDPTFLLDGAFAVAGRWLNKARSLFPARTGS